jgi:hypothetical protein
MKRVQGLAFATAVGVCLVTPVGPALAKSPILGTSKIHVSDRECVDNA